MQGRKYEIVQLAEEVHPTDCSKVWLVRMAVNGVLAPPFYDHEINRRKFQDDSAWFNYLAETAEALISERVN